MVWLTPFMKLLLKPGARYVIPKLHLVTLCLRPFIVKVMLKLSFVTAGLKPCTLMEVHGMDLYLMHVRGMNSDLGHSRSLRSLRLVPPSAARPSSNSRARNTGTYYASPGKCGPRAPHGAGRNMMLATRCAWCLVCAGRCRKG